MPLVWALTGSRVGDNQQVRHFCDALGFEVREVPLTYGLLRIMPNRLLGATTSSVSPGAREALQPPWPDLIVGAGQRSVPVARWVQQQSGGRTKIVFLGRPRAPLDWFDLVVTTPQYGLPAGDNVMTVGLPYVQHQLAPIDAGVWLARWRGLPRPLTAVLIGGSTPPYKLNARSVRRVVALAEGRPDGGAVIFATSPRTPAAATRLLAEVASGVGEICPWLPGEDNPYPALLAEAERFIVTEDSVSMIAEAVETGKPVIVAPVARRPAISWQAGRGLAGALARKGILSPPRNVRRLVKMLAASGQVSLAGDDGAAVQKVELATWIEALTCTRRLVV